MTLTFWPGLALYLGLGWCTLGLMIWLGEVGEGNLRVAAAWILPLWPIVFGALVIGLLGHAAYIVFHRERGPLAVLGRLLRDAATPRVPPAPPPENPS